LNQEYLYVCICRTQLLQHTVCVFKSGEQDLYPITRDLLLYDRRRIAELQVKNNNGGWKSLASEKGAPKMPDFDEEIELNKQILNGSAAYLAALSAQPDIDLVTLCAELERELRTCCDALSAMTGIVREIWYEEREMQTIDGESIVTVFEEPDLIVLRSPLLRKGLYAGPERFGQPFEAQLRSAFEGRQKVFVETKINCASFRGRRHMASASETLHRKPSMEIRIDLTLRLES
jgi:hypothetical protein